MISFPAFEEDIDSETTLKKGKELFARDMVREIHAFSGNEW